MLGSQSPLMLMGYRPAGDKTHLARYAGTLASAGLSVLVVDADSKHPAKVDDIMTAKAANEWQGKGGVYLASRDPATVRSRVREFEKSRGVSPNLGVVPDGRTFIIADVDTREAMELFRSRWSQWGGDPAYLEQVCGQSLLQPMVSTPGKRDKDGKWVHSFGGHFYLTLPEGTDLTSGPVKRAYAEAGAEISLMIHSGAYCLIPPSTRAEGAYRMTGTPIPCPPLLVYELSQHAEARAEKVAARQERERAIAEGELEVDDAFEAFNESVSWASLLVDDGFVWAGVDSSCGCSIYTAPGQHASPKSATAHERGCSLGYEYNLKLWTTNPPEALAQWLDPRGTSMLSKMSYLAAMHFGGDMGAAMRSRGITPRPPKRDVWSAQGLPAPAVLTPGTIASPALATSTTTSTATSTAPATATATAPATATATATATVSPRRLAALNFDEAPDTEDDIMPLDREETPETPTVSRSYEGKPPDDVLLWAAEVSQGLGRQLSKGQIRRLWYTAHPPDEQHRTPTGVTPSAARDRIYPAGLTNDVTLLKKVFSFSPITRAVFWAVENDDTMPVSPVPVLLHHMLRVARRVPLEVFSHSLTPAERRNAGSLLGTKPPSFFTAVCGRSGMGKTNSGSVPLWRTITPAPGIVQYEASDDGLPITDEVFDRSADIASPQALGLSLMEDKENEDGTRSKVMRQHPVAAIKIDELSSLTARSKGDGAGATLLQALASGWSNENFLPSSIANGHATLRPPFLLTLEAGIQPRKAGQLLASSDLGLMQRFYFSDASYTLRGVWMPRDIPEPPPFTEIRLPSMVEEVNGSRRYAQMKLCASAIEAFRANAAVSAAPQLEDTGETRSQELVIRTRLAGIFALMHGQTEVTEEIWAWSDAMMELHRRTLAMVEAGAEESVRDEARVMGRKQAIANRSRDTMMFEQEQEVLELVMAILTDAGSTGATATEIVRHSSVPRSMRDDVKAAVNMLISSGQLAATTVRGGRRVWLPQFAGAASHA